MDNELQKLYRESASAVRASFGDDAARSRQFYANLISFVRHVSPPAARGATRLLDVGCGSGWSTYHFAEEGYDALGIDLNSKAFEPPQNGKFSLACGSATDIRHLPDSFDVVVSYQCLEHVPDPAKALDEMVRVCRPGGTVAIVGPNLLSPTAGLAPWIKPSFWREAKFRRRAGMPSHPYGDTVPEIALTSLKRSWELLWGLAKSKPQFLMRKADTDPPFHGDNDACYLCNPTDLIHYFAPRGMQIICRGRPGRPPISYLFAGGTWVAARKGNSPTLAKP